MRHIGTSTLALLAALVAGPALASPSNLPPPAGTVILDLNGTAISHSYQSYSVTFTASSNLTNLSFALRDDPAFLLLDNVSLKLNGAGANLVVNGGFESGPVDANQPTGWSYLNSFGAAYAGVVGSNCGNGGGNCYYDGAVQAYDGISQAIATTAGASYTLTFDLAENSNLSTYSSLSTNGDVSGIGGNGINLVVYAGAIPTAVPEPTTLVLLGAGLLGLGATRRMRRRAA